MAFDLSAIGASVDTRYPADLAVQAMAALTADRPDLVLRPGSIETLLIEGLALGAAEISNAANEAVATWLESLLANFYQVARLPGTPATGGITVTFDTAVTQTIPAGTGFSLVDYGVEVQTTADVDVTASTTAVLDVATVEATEQVNGVGTDAALDVLDVIPNVLSVAVTSAFGGGSAGESDDATFVARARSVLALVSNSLVVPDAFAEWVKLDGRATNAVCIPAWDGADTGTIGSDGGHMTVVTYGRGANLTTEVLDELAAAMTAITSVDKTAHTVAATTVDVDVTVTVKGAAGYSSSEVQAATEAAVAAFLNPETWVFGEDVLTGALAAAISDTAAVDYVVSMTDPSGTTTLDADEAPVPGTVSVSVT